MIFDRPIYVPNVILIDLPENLLKNALQKIMDHLLLPGQIVGVNAMADDYYLSSRKIIIHQEDYEIYREYYSSTVTPSKYLLDAGTKVTYFIDASAETFKAAFVHMYDLIGDEYPIVCISDQLTNHLNSSITIVQDKKAMPEVSKRIKSTFMELDDFLNVKIEYKNNQFIIK